MSDVALLQKGSLDMILNTASGRIPLDLFLELLKLRGSLVCVSLPDEGARSCPPLRRPPSARWWARTSAARRLRGDAQHVEQRAPPLVMPVERINEAVARVRAGDARYRVVLEMPS